MQPVFFPAVDIGDEKKLREVGVTEDFRALFQVHLARQKIKFLAGERLDEAHRILRMKKQFSPFAERRVMKYFFLFLRAQLLKFFLIHAGIVSDWPKSYRRLHEVTAKLQEVATSCNLGKEFDFAEEMFERELAGGLGLRADEGVGEKRAE